MRTLFCFFLSLFILILDASCAYAKDFKILLISDAHYPSKSIDLTRLSKLKASKDEAAKLLSRDSSVDLVVFLGDVVARNASPSNLSAARSFINVFSQPKIVIPGNHELVYKDRIRVDGKLLRATSKEVKTNQSRFQYAFESKLRFAQVIGGYQLIFICGDDPNGEFLVSISKDTIAWLDDILGKNAHLPSIIFCHAPLAGTLLQYNQTVNFGNNIANPDYEIKAVLKRHPNVCAWVSGHTHTKATAESFNHPINVFNNRILNIHNPSWERGHLFANFLLLKQDSICIRTFDLKQKSFAIHLDRTWPIK